MEESDLNSTLAGRVFQRTVALAEHPELFHKEPTEPRIREELQQRRLQALKAWKAAQEESGMGNA